MYVGPQGFSVGISSMVAMDEMVGPGHGEVWKSCKMGEMDEVVKTNHCIHFIHSLLAYITLRHNVACVVELLCLEEPFYTRVELIRAVVAFANSFRDDMKRPCHGPKAEYGNFYIPPPRAKWYFNNVRIRHGIACGRANLMAAGATSNESLHAEIHKSFKETLDMKLDVPRSDKFLSHSRALYHATTWQMTHSTAPQWTGGSWNSWWEELQDAGTAKTKTDLPLDKARLIKRNEHVGPPREKQRRQSEKSAKRWGFGKSSDEGPLGSDDPEG